MKSKREGTEAYVQDAIRAMLWSECGIKSDKIPGSTLLRGFPDLYCGCQETGMFHIEVKAPGKKLRESQVTWMEKWDASARIYVVDDPEKLWKTVFLDREKLVLAQNHWRWAAPKGPRLDSVVREWASGPRT